MNTTLTVISVFAIIAGPILAIQVQKLIERITQKRDEKRRLFMTLMATRGRPLVPEHVQALNMIDIIFSAKSRMISTIMSIIFWHRSKKDKAVIEAWSELRDHLYNFPKQPALGAGTDTSEADASTYKVQLETWASKKDDLLIELLDKMAKSLGYHFDKVLLKRGSYTPQKYGDLETFQMINLAGFAEVLLGTKSIPVRIVGVPSTEGTKGSQEGPSQKPKQDDPSETPKQDAQQENLQK